ncbi:MAG: hypothetical protein IJH07_04740 [Ruminococcus sp.]|nr:hypothetical protein [Ruminococcus sp.]
MSFLSDIKAIIQDAGVPVATSFFDEEPPDTYAVITSMIDDLAAYADDLPQKEVCEARISVFTKRNYTSIKNSLTRAFLSAGFTITDRRYIEFDPKTGYHHYNIDVENVYEYEMEE